MLSSSPTLSSSRASVLPILFNALLALVSLLPLMEVVQANPKSRPYVAYRTSPYDQEIVSRKILQDGMEQASVNGPEKIQKNDVNRNNLRGEEDTRCPLSFRLGSTHSAHFGSGGSSSSSSSRTATTTAGASGSSSVAQQQSSGVGTHTPPIIYPLHPDFDAGSGRQILLTTDYEVLEMWTPSSSIGTHDYNPAAKSSSSSASGITTSASDNGGSSGTGGTGGNNVEGAATEQLKEDEQYPLLFESSSFYHTSPIVHDVEGDGVSDAILGDYDGNLHLVGLDFEHNSKNNKNDGGRGGGERRKRYYRRVSIPRLYVRKAWYETAINRTSENNLMDNTTARDENHTKWEEFEPYHTYFAGTADEAWRGKADAEALRGVSGNVLNMDVDLARGLAERQKRRKLQSAKAGDLPNENVKGNKKNMEEEDKSDSVEEGEDGMEEYLMGEGVHRRLQEAATANDASDASANNEATEGEGGERLEGYADDYNFAEEGLFDDAMGAPPDGYYEGYDDALGAPPDGSFGEDSNEVSEGADSEGGEGEASQGKGDVWNGDDAYPGTYGTDDYADYHRYGYGDDIYQPEAPEGWDSYDQYQEAQNAYYDDKHYLRLPPHLLSTCALAELPRMYAGSSSTVEDRVDELVLCAVSYYFDEDECMGNDGDGRESRGKSFGKHANVDGGDETEEMRGRYMASAILGYNLRWKYWSVQEVLDLSTDWSAPLGDIAEGGTAEVHSNAHHGMGAWALATPVAVKLDGSDRNHIIVGTSMGLVYALEVQWHNAKTGWPVQMRHPVEQKVLVEDVVGNTNLEVFVVDTGGDLVSLDADGNVLWARNLLREDESQSTESSTVPVVLGTSPMSLGDVEGTGKLAIVLVARITTADRQHVSRPDKHEVMEHRLYAIDAVTGDDIPNFPIALDSRSSTSSKSEHHVSSSIPQPLLIDLHEDQHHWLNRIRGLSHDDVTTIRAINSEASKQYHDDGTSPRPHGGSGRGLHIVQPLGSILHIIEGATSCEQPIDVGDTIPAMVQADDVHGTGGLDLVVTTSQGEILTLESDVVPYHPLNVWSAGVSRAPGSGNAGAHGFSSTQGIFVHPISRQFRDILGIYVPITFEIFDRRPNIQNEDNRRVYAVDIRAGMSVKRTIFTHTYNETGVYTERIQIPFGPGYYSFSVRMRSTHGIVYEDTFHIGWNVNYMGGLWMIVCLPLVLAAIPILMFKRKPNWEEDEDYGGSRGSGILGRAPPPS